MSTTSVWAMDLGGAVTRVTRRRDGFRKRPDERFERGCGGLPQLVATSGGGKCEQSPQSSTLADEFLRAKSRNVAIFSYVAVAGTDVRGYSSFEGSCRLVERIFRYAVKLSSSCHHEHSTRWGQVETVMNRLRSYTVA